MRKTLLVFLLGGIGALSTYGFYSWKSEEYDAYENFQILSSFLASASQAFFEDIGNSLEPVGELLEHMDVRKYPEAARPHLLLFQKRHPQVRAVAVFAPDGEMLVNTAVKPGEPLPDFRLDPPYIKQLLTNMASTELYTVGPPEYGKAIKVWRFSIRHVVKDRSGKAKFMVQAAVPLEKEDTFLHQLPVPLNTYIGLLRADGFQQARFPVQDDVAIYGSVTFSPVARMIKEQPGIREGHFSGPSAMVKGDKQRIGAFTKLQNLDMYAYISVPASYLMQRWWQHNAPVLLSFVVFFLLFAAIAYRVAKREGMHSLELINQARRDALTGLPNRASLNSILNANISSAGAGQRKFSILFLDLDRFKGINDTFGHAIGDKLLIQVVTIIQPLLRSGDVLGRFGGDEFLLILPGSDETGAVLITQRILDAFSVPCQIDGRSLRITLSVGIAIFPDHGSDIETLMKHADTAMYESKRLGRNAYTIYVDQMGRRVRDRMEMEHQLREALQNNTFRLVYQPIIDMKDGEIVGVEALLRWQMQNGRWRMPSEFIHIAEDSGLIIPLGEWVLRTACIQQKNWLASGLDLTMAVNLSTRQFLDPNLLEKVMSILSETEVNPSRLKLEVTESAAMHNPEESVEILCALTEKGVRIAIDDFGTGYSSLGYLKRLPADTIKIDKSFVEGVGCELQDATIVRTVIALAHALGKVTVAEGIETREQYQAIQAMGCNFAQGYLISVPLSAEELTNLLNKGKKLIALPEKNAAL